MYDKLEAVLAKFEDLERELASPALAQKPQLLQKLSKEHKGLEALILKYKDFKVLQKQWKENRLLIEEAEDAELVKMAYEENKQLEEKIPLFEKELQLLLLPKDPRDDKNVFLEIRAGAGGDEAGIFAGDLFRLYTRFSEKKGWALEVVASSLNSVGGFKEIICQIRGEKVYSFLKHESGVHRVQRVPQTETQGRVHTSTVTVAILPEAEEVELHIDPNELRIDIFRSSGPGGQSVNTTDSAVRITHLPTGLMVVCQDEKSQHKNKAKALNVLRARLFDKLQSERDAKISQERLSQVGTGERSEKIRTYNYPQSRVTDHRIGFTEHNLTAFMEGAIDPLLQALTAFYQAEQLKKNDIK